MAEPMSNEEYIQNTRSACPYCASTHIDYDPMVGYGWYISQSCWCLECKARWSDNFKFERFDVEEADEESSNG